MPAVYSSVAQFNRSLGYHLQSYTATFVDGDSAGIGVLDEWLIEASEAVRRMTGRSLAAPPKTTLASSANSGDITLDVASVANVDQQDVVVFPSTGETIEVTGAQVDVFEAPYRGTLFLAVPVTGTYNAGTTVEVYRQEQYQIRGRRTGLDLDDVLPFSQEGQIAAMHAPKFGRGENSRLIFLRQYPVLSLYAAYEALPWSNVETAVNLSGVLLDKQEGWYRLPVGFFNPKATMWRTQYAAGHVVIPRDIASAVHNLMAARIVMGQNAVGVASFKIGDVSMAGVGGQYIQEAQRLLSEGNWIRTGMV